MSEAQLGKARFVQAGNAGEIREDQSRLLNVQRIRFLIEIRHKQIDEAILIRIPARDSHAGL